MHIVNTKAVIPNEMCQLCKYFYWLCLVRPPMLFWEHSIRREELRTATKMAAHDNTFYLFLAEILNKVGVKFVVYL